MRSGEWNEIQSVCGEMKKGMERLNEWRGERERSEEGGWRMGGEGEGRRKKRRKRKRMHVWEWMVCE